MKKIILVTFSLCCFFATKAQQGLLMKITSSGSTEASYIFFTTEHKDISQYNFQTSITGVVEKVNAVVFDWLQDEQQRSKMFEIMQFKGDDNVKNVYGRDDNIRYELMIINKLKSEVEKYAKTQPLYTLQTFRDTDHDGGVGFQNQEIFQIALGASKPVLSILSARQIEEIFNLMDFETQAAVLSNYVNNEKKFLATDDENFSNYLQGNMDNIAKTNAALQLPSFISTIQNKETGILLLKIIALSSQQSTLFVIDAGKAGGDNGLLKKLKNADYTIEPVDFIIEKNKTEPELSATENISGDNFPALPVVNTSGHSNKTIVLQVDEIKKLSPNKYTALYDPFNDLFDYATADTAFIKSWHEVFGVEGNCKIKIPVKADWEEVVSETNSGAIKSYTYSGNHARSDLFYSFGYTVYPPAFDAGNKADFLTGFVKRQVVKLKGNLVAQRIISTPDYVGREFTVVISDSFFVRSKLFLKDNILYQLLSGGPNNNAYSAYTDAFFNSFKIDNASATSWFFYENPMFTVNLPTPPLKSTQSVNTKFGALTLQTYSAEDYKEGISYLVSVYLYPPAYEFENNFMDKLVSDAERQYAGKAIKNERVKKNGIGGRYVELQLNNNKIYKIYFLMQGNIVYQYLAGGSSLAMLSAKPDYFFNTFTLVGDEK